MKFAKSTPNPELAAKLINKGADLMSQSDPLPDISIAPPDVGSDNQANT